MQKYVTTSFPTNELSNLLQQKYDQFPNCTDVVNVVPEYYEVYPKLKETFSFHKLEQLRGARWENLTKGMPDDLIVHRVWKSFSPRICRDNNISSIKRISQKMRGKDTEYLWEDKVKL